MGRLVYLVGVFVRPRKEYTLCWELRQIEPVDESSDLRVEGEALRSASGLACLACVVVVVDRDKV